MTRVPAWSFPLGYQSIGFKKRGPSTSSPRWRQSWRHGPSPGTPVQPILMARQPLIDYELPVALRPTRSSMPPCELAHCSKLACERTTSALHLRANSADCRTSYRQRQRRSFTKLRTTGCHCSRRLNARSFGVLGGFICGGPDINKTAAGPLEARRAPIRSHAAFARLLAEPPCPPATCDGTIETESPDGRLDEPYSND